jgi:hypothetical protein
MLGDGFESVKRDPAGSSFSAWNIRKRGIPAVPFSRITADIIHKKMADPPAKADQPSYCINN